jgi:hypothetical protein
MSRYMVIAVAKCTERLRALRPFEPCRTVDDDSITVLASLEPVASPG